MWQLLACAKPSCYRLLRTGITRCAVLRGSLCLCVVSVVERCDLTDIKGKIYFIFIVLYCVLYCISCAVLAVTFDLISILLLAVQLRGMLSGDDASKEQVERQVLNIWDKIYQTWFAKVLLLIAFLMLFCSFHFTALGG